MTSQWRWWLGIVAVAGLVLYALSSVLLPFVAGMVVAYFLNPAVTRLEGWGLGRSLGALVLMLLFFSLGGLVIALLEPRIQAEILDTLDHIPEYRHSIEAWAMPLLQHYVAPQDLERLQAALGDHAGDVARYAVQVVGRILRGGLAVMDVLSLLFIMPIVTFYLLRDWTLLVAKVAGWLPRPQAQEIMGQLAEIDQMLSAFVRGQVLVCALMAAFYGVALSAVGVDLGLVIGMLAGLMSFVPYLGVLAGLTASVGMAIAQTGAWHLPMLAAIVFVIGHLAESNFITPKLVGERIGLHPLWIMFALMSGAALVGFVGMLLAVPVAAVVGVLLRYAIARYLASPLYHGAPPS